MGALCPSRRICVHPRRRPIPASLDTAVLAQRLRVAMLQSLYPSQIGVSVASFVQRTLEVLHGRWCQRTTSIGEAV